MSVHKCALSNWLIQSILTYLLTYFIISFDVDLLTATIAKIALKIVKITPTMAKITLRKAKTYTDNRKK